MSMSGPELTHICRYTKAQHETAGRRPPRPERGLLTSLSTSRKLNHDFCFYVRRRIVKILSYRFSTTCPLSTS